MKKIILSILFSFLIITIFTGCASTNQSTNSSLKVDEEKSTNDIWEKINETTWFKDNGWAGESYVFYVDNHGIKKCIHQVHGSGVDVVSRKFVDFEIITDNELKIENEVYKLNNDEFVSGDIILTLQNKKPLIYNRIGLLDIEIVKSDEFVVEDIDKQYTNQKR